MGSAARHVSKVDKKKSHIGRSCTCIVSGRVTSALSRLLTLGMRAFTSGRHYALLMEICYLLAGVAQRADQLPDDRCVDFPSLKHGLTKYGYH